MEKKLPKVFANKIDKNLENNDNYFYSANSETSQEDIRESKEQSFIVHGENVQQKIQSIFNSPRYVYKADVDITLKDGKVSKRIIGKNMTHLITIDNELIPISDIIDIDFSA